MWQADQVSQEDRVENELPQLFRFDPNTVTHAELASLGFSSRLANQLINYRNKGGRFQSAQDLLKLYEMDSVLYNHLAPYIVIPEVNARVRESGPGTKKAELTIAPFDLNLADTTQLIAVKGIGTVLSKRIIKYRDLLGGFVDKNQLFEVYGLDSLVVQRLTKQSFIHHDFKPRAINLNEASEAELAAHPYLSKAMARAIVTYRFQHGVFHSVDDLAELKSIPLESLHKAKPYLTIE
ncbi:helix-hairpin-helix domain-containing protein [Oscillatoria amoena NRMC-F 0135]|nr:helix-hairpin-helix domain-containing protein [Oscillatoria amoena NRMC-F 0135]